jgi:hypothetical protein
MPDIRSEAGRNEAGENSSLAMVMRVCCGAVRRLETAESGLNRRKPRFGHKIAVRRYRPVRKFG